MTIYHKSSSNMAEINDESVHLIVTSPPYPMISKRMYSVIGDTVLDPFAGTGTTGIVAERIKRNYIGYTLPD